MRNLKLTDEQAAIILQALVNLHAQADEKEVNTNYYGSYRSLDNAVTSVQLRNNIDDILVKHFRK